MKQYNMRLTTVIGAVVFARTSTKTYTGTKEQLEAKYQQILQANLVFGWWSIFSLVWNPLALYRNYDALKQLNAL